MTGTSARSPKPFARVLTPVAIVCALAAALLTLTSLQLEMICRRAVALDARLTTVADALAVQHADLTTNFSTAADMRETLKTTSAEIAAVRTEAVELGTTSHLPGASVEPLTSALVARADSLATYGDDLLTSADFVITRAQDFTAVASALDKLSGLSKEGVTVAQGQEIVRDARTDFDAAVAKMRNAAPPTPVLYSNIYVLPRLDELSASLSDIEESIIARDVDKIASALKTYMAAVGEDWASCMTRHDPAGRQALNAAARTVDDLAPMPEKRVKELRVSGQPLSLLALAAGVIAGLSAFGAWWWRDTRR